MAISELGICNSALIKLGVEKISALDNSTRQGAIMSEQYAKIRDSLLYDHPWNFAMKRITSTANVTVPEYEFGYTHDLPSDCLRVWNTEYAEDFYQVEGRSLLTDNQTIKIKYVSQVTDPTKFTPAFAEALALKLAADTCYALVQSNSLKQTYLNEMQMYLPSVRSVDAQENPSYPLEQDIFINSRK
jgi:hypothetical protein